VRHRVSEPECCSLGATVALHVARRGGSVATAASGTYFGPIFTPAYVESRLANSSTALERARWQGVDASGRQRVYARNRAVSFRSRP
ncbi:MAG TPA: hypothetical protein VFG38_15095, partial [Pseudomonadales bacterium]|nr:hypothetical protein [Pseudomonadales bacterium]